MSPRHHFAEYAKRDPKGYRAFSDNLWNSFVSVTHGIGLSKFFSFTPPQEIMSDPAHAGERLGKALAEVYVNMHDTEDK